MNLLRKLGLTLTAPLFGLLLVLLVVTVSLNHVLGTPAFAKRSLADSGLYDRIVDDITAQAQTDADQAENSRLPLEREAIRAAAREAFSPELLQRSAESVIEGTYAWLEGKQDKPQFELDLSAAKADFANRLGSYMRQRVADLPLCTRPPASTDPLEIDCRPPGINLEPEIRRQTDELTNSPEFLGDAVINPEDLKITQNGQSVPFYQAADELPQAFSWLRLAPFIVGLLLLLMAATLIALSRPRKRGVRRLAIWLIITGLLTLAGWWLFGRAVDSLEQRVAEAPIHAGGFAQSSVASSLLSSLEQSLGGVILLFGLLYTGLGVLLLAIMWLLGRRNGLTPPETPLATEPAPDSPPADHTPDKPEGVQ